MINLGNEVIGCKIFVSFFVWVVFVILIVESELFFDDLVWRIGVLFGCVVIVEVSGGDDWGLIGLFGVVFGVEVLKCGR